MMQGAHLVLFAVAPIDKLGHVLLAHLVLANNGIKL